MSRSLVKIHKRLKQFIRAHWDQQSPLLLGFSGGSDSKALLYSLLEVGVPVHLAHVDHGWREESAREAEVLAEEAVRLKLPFHHTRLTQKPKTNLEDAARVARLQFFRSLFEQFPFQALMLAHHADDVAETVLKRILEGAHLSNLGGMSEVSTWEGMQVFRPFLSVKKQELVAYLQERSIPFFHDPTNQDRAFLRSRLRLDILPMLSTLFGKEVAGNLALMSERAFELKAYWEKRVEGRLEGERVNCRDLERIEARFLVQKALGAMGLTASREVLESMLEAIGTRGKQFVVKNGVVKVDGEVLVVYKYLKNKDLCLQSSTPETN